MQYAGRLQDEAEDLRAQYESKREELQYTLLDAWRKGGSPTEIADQLGIGRVRVYQLMDKAESRERGDESNGDGEG